MPEENLVPLEHLKRYGAVYSKAWKQAAEMRQAWESMPDFKPWCYLPVSAAAAIVEAEAKGQGITYQEVALDVGNLAALINWRMSKGIYRFDPTVDRKASSVCGRKATDCGGMSNLFVATMRANGAFAAEHILTALAMSPARMHFCIVARNTSLLMDDPNK